MSRHAPPLGLLLALLVPLGLVGAAGASDDPPPTRVVVARVKGKTTTATAVVSLTETELVLQIDDEATGVPLDDVIAITTGARPNPPRPFVSRDVALDLWSGEEVRGQITAGDDRFVSLRSPLLGTVRVEVDAIAGVRFLRRLAEVAEPPDLRSQPDVDVVHLVGGDRVNCTVVSIGADALECATSGDDSLDVPYEKITAFRLQPYETESADGRLATAVLRDGTRLMCRAPAVAEGRLTLASLSGFDVDAALDDVVAIHIAGAAYRYLSDLEAPEIEIKPFWKPVAGDPVSLYAPRLDRAFSGGRLTVGGGTWLKGIGVYSGTSLTWQLDGEYSEFRTSVGIDDAAGDLGSVVFEILVDGKRRWRSELVRAAAARVPGADDADHAGRAQRGAVDAGRLDVSGAKTLTLRVLAGNDEEPYPIQDEADWLGAMLVR